jgi:hypothetical protein
MTKHIATILHHVKHVKGVLRPWLEVPMLTSLQKPPYQGQYQQWKPFYMGITLNTLSQKG